MTGNLEIAFGLAEMSEQPKRVIMKCVSPLTPREMEILQLVVSGKTNKAIADRVCVSPKTVEFHLSNIYDKIGVRTRLLAGVWAVQQGLPVKKIISG